MMSIAICSICQLPCLPCLDGKYRKTNKGYSGKFMTPTADTMKHIQQFVETDPQCCGLSRDFNASPLCASDRFCLKATCLCRMFVSVVWSVEKYCLRMLFKFAMHVVFLDNALCLSLFL